MPTASASDPSPLAGLRFDNRFTRELPADPDDRVVSRLVHGACYSRVRPKAVTAPRLVAHSREMAAALGLDEAAVAAPAFAEVFSGNLVLPGMDPHAMCYGGHQFGHWAGQLGDGRAINLGEVVAADGSLQMLQLKGAGPTPYSRHADGLAVLRSSLREFVCSEAMYHLGVPTTRALSLVLTGEEVLRDMMYDGHPELEPGAVVCRVAPSFLRFGNYEILAATGQQELLQQLVDFTLATLYPELGSPGPETYLAWFREVCRRTAGMVVEWQRVGFVHGVMNTDNMSILGLTIDYGPYGWLEDFDPDWTPNTTDAQQRRYRFGQQGQVAQWNLAQLASAILPLIGAVEPLQEAITDYATILDAEWKAMMARKLGLDRFDAATDAALIDDLLAVLQLAETDMTIFFRRLAQVPVAGDPGGAESDPLAHFADAYYVADQQTEELAARTGDWLQRYRDRVRRDGTADLERRRRMDAVNPWFVPRNYLAQQAIDAAEAGGFDRLRRWLEVLRRPYDEQPDHAEFAARRPDWARHRPGCSMLSCSS